MSDSPAVSKAASPNGGKVEADLEVTYNKGQFVVVFEQSEINNFTIAQLLEDVASEAKEAKALFFTRLRQNKFRPDGEDMLITKYIVQVLDDASLEITRERVVRRSRSRKDDSPDKPNRKEQIKEVAVEAKIYKGVVAAAKKFRVEISDSEEEDDEDEESAEEEQGSDEEEGSPKKKARSQSQKRSPKKLKIVGPKGSTSQIVTKKIKRNTQGEDDDDLQVSKTSKGAGGKAIPVAFKKGIINPRVELIETCQQLESKSFVPNFDCSVRTSNRELIRAAFIGSKELMIKILNSQGKISRLNPEWGVDNKKTPLKLLIDQGNIDLLIFMVEVMSGRSETIKPRLTYDNPVAIKKIDTGYNDKYAYGVATRKVALSRGGRQGNNAFVEDVGGRARGDFDEEHQTYFLCHSSTTAQHVQKFLGHMPALEGQFIVKIPSILLAGNTEVANFLLERAFKNDGYGLNEYFTKSLMSSDVKSVEEIKKQSVPKKAFGIDNLTPLHCACLNPNADILKHLLTLNPEYHLVDGQLRKLVHFAAGCSSADPIKYLSECNLDTRELDASKHSPLMYACKYGKLEVVKFLLQDNRSTPLHKDKTGRNALHIAAENGHLPIVQALLDSGHYKVGMPGAERMTIMHTAAARNYFDIVKYLVEVKKMRPVHKDKLKRTALMLAAKNGNLKIVSYLLLKGAPYEEPDSSGNTCLHYACAYGYPEVIEVLVQAGANLNADNSWKLSPTAVALLKSYFSCLRKMLSYPLTNVNCIDDEGRTLVSNAVKSISQESYNHVSFLLQEKKADVSIPDSQGMVAFDYLIAHNMPNLVSAAVNSEMTIAEQESVKAEIKSLYKKFMKLFIDHGADINRPANDGLTPLLRAVKFKNSEAMNFLLDEPKIELGVASHKDGSTLLHYLADFVRSEDFFGLAKRLLDKLNEPALLNKYNFAGKTPLHLIFEQFVEAQPYFKAGFYSQLEKELREEKKRGVESHLAQMQANMSKFLAGGGGAQAASKKPTKIEPEDSKSHEDSDSESQESRPKAPAKSFFSTKAGGAPGSFGQFGGNNAGGSSFFGASSSALASSTRPFGNPSGFGDSGDGIGGSGFFGASSTSNRNLIGSSGSIFQQPQFPRFGQGVSFGNNQQPQNLNSIHITEAERIQLDNEATKMAQQRMDEFFVFIEGLLDRGADPQLLVRNPRKIDPEKEAKQGTLDEEDNPLNYFIRFIDQVQNAIRKKIDLPSEEKPATNVGYSLVHLAASSTEPSIYHFLLERLRIRLNQRSVYGETEIMRLISCCGGSDRSVSILKLLVQHGADPTLADYYSVTPLLQAVVQRKNVYARYLVEKDVDVNAQDYLGNYCLLQSVKFKDQQMIEFFLEKKADPNLRDISGRTCIHWAVNFSNLDTDASNEIDNMLLSSGADLNAIDNRGRTPLHYAFVKINAPFATNNIDPIETVSNLTSRPNIKIDVRDRYGNTPLNYAAQRGSVVSALHLCKKGANLNNMNNENNSPLNEALWFNHQTLSIFLIHEKARLDLPVFTPNKQRQKEEDGEVLDRPQKQAAEQKAQQAGPPAVQPQHNREAEYESSESELETDSQEARAQAEAEDEEEDVREESEDADDSENSDSVRSKTHESKLKPQKKSAKEEVEFGTSTFSIAIKNNCQSLAFLLIEYNYNLSLAILDCFNHRKFNYVYTLLLKKSQAGVYDAKNDKGQNLAHLFAKSASQIEENLFNKILSKMEQNNLDFDLEDHSKRTALHYAADCGSLKMIKILLEKGLNVNLADDEAQTPLAIIAKKYFYHTEQFVKDALPHGLDVNKRFLHKGVQHTLLTYVMSEKLDFRTFGRLANLGADLNASDSHGFTPLIYLVRQNREADLRNYLVTYPAVNLHVRDTLGRTVIHHVVKPRDVGSFENVSMLALLALKVNVNTEDSSGRPPMYYANSQHSGRMRNALKDWGAKEYSDEPKLQKTTTAWLSESAFPTNHYNFEEDFAKFVEECQERAAKHSLDIEEKCPVDHCATGNYEVVYEENQPFDALMVKVDISKGYYSGNTFYKMQILREKVRDIYVLFTKWGRLGDDGQYQQTPFSKFDECKKEFCSVFKAKSGNLWENRHKFEKVDKKYRLLPVTKKTKFERYLKAFNYKDSSLPETKLTKALFKFIRRICNSKVFSNAITSEFKIDENLLPLQQLTRDRLLNAEAILNGLEKSIKEYADSKTKNDLNLITQHVEELMKLTSEYYELIPSTRFSTQAIPPITTLQEVVQLKRALNDLLYFEIAIKLLCGATFRIKELNPMDYIYRTLAVKLMSVEKKSEEYQIIQ